MHIDAECGVIVRFDLSQSGKVLYTWSCIFDGRGHRYNTNPGRYDILILEAVVSCDNYASSSRGHVQVGVQFAARFGQIVVLLAKVCAS